MGTRILLGSGGFRSDDRRERLVTEMQRHFGGIRRLLFVPYAHGDLDGYSPTMTSKGFHAGYELDSIHRHSDPRQAVAEAEGIYIGGGNTFRLIHELHRLGLVEAIRARVLAGMPYLGISAGSNVACPTMQTTNDMPIIQPASFRALGLVPFQINAHYFNGDVHVQTPAGLVPHFGETRDERLTEFHELNDTPVIGLWEGGLLRVYDGQIELIGSTARIFEKGQPVRDVEPGVIRFAR